MKHAGKYAVIAEGISKKYRIREKSTSSYRSLREEVSQYFTSLFKNPLTFFNNGESEMEDFWALKDVSFQLNEGDRLGIIGRNGAGKSTLLKILSRITEPTTGRVKIAGRVASLLEVGTGFHPELTGRENIYLNGSILGMSRSEIKKKFDEIVEFAEIGRFLDTPVKRYSSGMYVRLAFSVAAYLESDILIVDEVLAVGDAQFQKKCLGRMGELSNSGRTVIFVTHNIEAMLAICNRAIVLTKGRLAFDGNPNEAREFYLSQTLDSEHSVANNAGRGGSGGVTIQNVDVIFNDSGQGYIYSGEPLSLLATASVDDGLIKRNDLDLAFSINASDGTRLFTGRSSWDGCKIDASSGLIKVQCDFKEMPLAPGKYLIDVSIVFREDTLDCVIHCASFEVLPRKREMYVDRLSGWGSLDLPVVFKNVN